MKLSRCFEILFLVSFFFGFAIPFTLVTAGALVGGIGQFPEIADFGLNCLIYLNGFAFMSLINAWLIAKFAE